MLISKARARVIFSASSRLLRKGFGVIICHDGLPNSPHPPLTQVQCWRDLRGGGGWQLWRDYLIGGIVENFPTDNGPVKRKDYFLMLPRLPSKSQNVNLKINTPVKRLGLKYRYQVGCCTYRKRESCAVNTSRRRNKHTAPKTQYSV